MSNQVTRFNVCDLNAIETRVGAWLAGATDLMEVFRPRMGPDGKWRKNGNDPYLDFAVKMTGLDYEQMWYDLKILPKTPEGKTPEGKKRTNEVKRHRQVAKPGVLGAIYRLGGGDYGVNKYGDQIKTGLWGYAENMSVEMSRDQAHEVVRVFRESYPQIPEFWYELERMTAEVLDERVKNVERKVGPGGAVTMNRLNVTMGGRAQFLFRMRLPSGRYLHYIDARIEETMMPWSRDDGEAVYRPTLWYAGQDQVTKQWGRIQSHGGKQFENLVQGIARDVLAVKLLEFEEHDLPVHGHVHDEGICVVPNDPFSPGVELMEEIMAKPIDWAPGLLLGADGFEDTIYHK